jgi:alkylation response protein AidB-like acyl-CoA dehydrogenase
VGASLAILNAGSQADHERWLPSIAAGDAVAGLAYLEDAGRPRPEDVATVWRAEGEGFRLSGRKVLVLDAPNLDLLVVSARREGTQGSEGVGLFVVLAQADGLRVEAVEPLDLSRRLGDVELDDAPAHRLGDDDALAALALTLDQSAIAQSAEMVGATAGCLEMAVEYAKTRVQFARPIGSFQAIQHKAAEVLLELECARSTAYWAWWAASQQGGDLTEPTSLAKAVCADAFVRAATENLQIHGGLGVTWEHDAHLFYRRAQAADALFGSAGSHRARLAKHLGL